MSSISAVILLLQGSPDVSALGSKLHTHTHRPWPGPTDGRVYSQLHLFSVCSNSHMTLW